MFILIVCIVQTSLQGCELKVLGEIHESRFNMMHSHQFGQACKSWCVVMATTPTTTTCNVHCTSSNKISTLFSQIYFLLKFVICVGR
jgi:hypothetical protein